MCMNSECKFYWEDCCTKDMQDKRIILGYQGVCETYEKGVSDWYEYGTESKEMSNVENEWCYSFDKIDFTGGFDTKEEALEEAKAEIDCDSKYSGFKGKLWIGKAVYAELTDIDADILLERIAEEAYQDAPDGHGDDYLDYVPNEQVRELEKQLNEVWHEWAEKYNHKPHWFTAVDVEEVALR